jgi:DNA-directed RNA polymerase specialized sigma24 family protein
MQRRPAWLTKVSFNIIREHKRKACRDQVISQELTSHDEFKNRNEEQKELDCEMKKKINFLLKSLSELKEEDLEIIRLRFVQGLTWDETSKYLIRFRGDLKIKKTENSLRKRGSRILYRLRQAFEDFDDVA